MQLNLPRESLLLIRYGFFGLIVNGKVESQLVFVFGKGSLKNIDFKIKSLALKSVSLM